MTWVGRSIRRVEDPNLVKGMGRFTADAAVGAKHVRFVRSQVARGTIVSIEAPAEGLVVVADDITDVSPIRPILNRPDYRAIAQPILARDHIRYVGEPVAAVIAESPEAAEDLADRVIVDIDWEDPVVDLEAAVRRDAQAVHEGAPDNVVVEGTISTPNVAACFQEAAEIVEFELRSRRQSAAPIETRGGHVRFDEASQRVTLMASVQMPHMIRTGIADCLGMPEADLRIVAPDVGGAFGQKMSLVPEYVFLVWAARRFRTSMAWIEDRRENFLAGFHSRDHHYRCRAAFDTDAHLMALEADLTCNVGAYSCYPVTWGVEPLMAMAELPGPYRLAEYSVRARGIATNTCPMAPYRGVSRPVITMAMERLMDIAAGRFDLDAVEIRRRNLIEKFPHASPTGIVYDEGSYVESLDRAVETIDVDGFRKRQKRERGHRRYLGLGFSVFSERTGYGTPAFAARGNEITPGYERVEMSMDPSGYVEVRIGASPHGQGLETSLSQLVADELGTEPNRIRVRHGDTDTTPYGWGTFGSRSIVISGGACKLAAEKLRSKLAAIAGAHLEADPRDIELVGGRAFVKGTDLGIEISTLARIAHHMSHTYDSVLGPGLGTAATYDPIGTFSNACHAAIVEVDIDTGGVRVERFVVVEDAGVLVNPMIVEGQIHGGVVQGIANALFEEIVYDPLGNILTTSFMDYLPPTLSEVPVIEIVHLETTTDRSVTGAKGVGEGGAIGAPAAVINAVADALRPFEIDLLEFPMTPERIQALLRSSTRRVV